MATLSNQFYAIESSTQASNAINRSVHDARKEKRKARHSVKDAKKARSAHNKEKDQEKKIAELRN